jgi:hydroxypyruvate isomerase
MSTRRAFLATGGALAALAPAAERKGRLKQCATTSCFGKMDFEEMCRQAARLGLKGLDLIGPERWPLLKTYGLLSSMVGAAGHSLTEGINRKENHARIEPAFRQMLDRAAAFGAPNLIALSGNRRGLGDEEGIENCALFLNRVKAQAEDKGVTICLELLNSKVDHPDYQCDHTAWGVAVMKRVNSPRVKLLYDIYHMQIMEGDIIRTIRQNIQYISHFHTGGVPGRHELDGTQELQWRSVAEAIAATGFAGYFAHEFVPTRDPMKSLEEAARLCDV